MSSDLHSPARQYAVGILVNVASSPTMTQYQASERDRTIKVPRVFVEYALSIFIVGSVDSKIAFLD